MRNLWFKKYLLYSLLTYAAACVLSGCNDVSNAPPPQGPPTGLAITTTSLPPGTVNQPYAATVSATGGKTPYTWSVTPTLPANLSFDPTTAVITGIPATQGTTNHTFSVQDSSTPVKSAQQTIALNIPVPPSITTTSLPPGTVNAPYTATLTAAGGIPPLVWQPVGLPFGLTFDPSTQMISGTPTSVGTQPVTFTVNDSAVPFNQTGSATFTLIVNAVLLINTGSLPDGAVNQPYGPLTLTASGGAPPYSWSTTGGTPPAPGLSLNAGGVISGTPTTAGSFTSTYRLQDSNGIAVTKALPLNVATLVITTPSPLPNGRELFLYTSLAPLTTMTASGGVQPYTWSVTPPLPTGLTLNASNGQITGIPILGTAGTTVHTFTVTDSTNATTSKPNMSLTIAP